jgi:hypothetical protein
MSETHSSPECHFASVARGSLPPLWPSAIHLARIFEKGDESQYDSIAVQAGKPMTAKAMALS